MADCAGHFGYIQLELPVFHVGYMKHTLNILQCICKQCARILLPPNERANLLRRFKNPRSDALSKSATFKKIVDLCKRNLMCGHCGYANGIETLLVHRFYNFSLSRSFGLLYDLRYREEVRGQLQNST